MGCTPLLDYASCLPFVTGKACDGSDLALEKPTTPGVLYGPNGQACARWATGADDSKIILPGMAVKSKPAAGLLVQDSAGRVYRLIPDPSLTGKNVLVQEAGATYYQSIGSANGDFNPSDLVDGSASSCGFSKIAIFSSCGSTLLKLGYVSPSALIKLLLSSDTDGACENIPVYDADTDGDTVAPLLCAGGNIRKQGTQDNVGLTFHPVPYAQILSITTFGNHPVDLPNFPTHAPGAIHVLIDYQVGFNGTGSIETTMNGEVVCTISGSSGNNADVLTPVTVAHIVYQTFGIGSPDPSGDFSIAVLLKGYFY